MKTLRYRLTISGVVQGVGFRPFVVLLAEECSLSGWVRNFTGGVEIEIEGNSDSLGKFIRLFPERKPVAALIEEMQTTDVEATGEKGFSILPSFQSGEAGLISPDLAICSDCLEEMRDENNRRYRYPFINCTNCGPRYTITRCLPYDRANTTMDNFEMCEACRSEYESQKDRRYHAQPIACQDCGPQLSFYVPGEREVDNTNEALHRAVQALKEGKIVAIKGIGGFHLACDAFNEDTVKELRHRKGRENKPFAMMARNVESITDYAEISEDEKDLLLSPAAPIVLLQGKGNLPSLIAPGLREYGVMLPYTPLHHLLMENFSLLIMSSGNVSGEPMIIRNEEACESLATVADAFLLHDRDIFIPCDDSVVRIVENEELVIRRGRGYAPFPVSIVPVSEDSIGLGAEIKNSICIVSGGRAFISEHIGDMINDSTFQRFKKTIAYYQEQFSVNPIVAGCDMHPAYQSTRFAKTLDIPTISVQHHHAHAVSVLAEKKIAPPAIAVVFDGTGWGVDGKIWGSEIGISDYSDFNRYACLTPFPVPGGDMASREPWRVGLSLLLKTFAGNIPVDYLLFPSVSRADLAIAEAMMEKDINTPYSSGAGRFFEGAAAILGIALYNSYEGEAAMRLEGLIRDENCQEAYEYRFTRKNDIIEMQTSQCIEGIVADIIEGMDNSLIAIKIHNMFINMILDRCLELSTAYGLVDIVLSGGCMQNNYLLRSLLRRLRTAGMMPHVGKLVPCNDAGIALGQALVALERRKKQCV